MWKKFLAAIKQQTPLDKALADLAHCKEERLKSELQIGIHEAHVIMYAARVESLEKFINTNGGQA